MGRLSPNISTEFPSVESIEGASFEVGTVGRRIIAAGISGEDRYRRVTKKALVVVEFISS